MSKAPARRKVSKKAPPPSQKPFTDLLWTLYQHPGDCEKLFLKVLAVFQEYSPGMTTELVVTFLKGAVCGDACAIDEQLADEAGPPNRSRSKVHKMKLLSSGVAGDVGGAPSGATTRYPYKVWPMHQFPSF